jgi:hypothetical protein
MILRESVPTRAPVRALFGVVLLALIALPGFTDGQPQPDRARTADPAPRDAAPVVAAEGATRVAVDEREQRLQKLEATLEALIKEVKDLRGASGKAPSSQPKPAPRDNPTTASPGNKGYIEYQIAPYVDLAHGKATAPAPDQPVQLTRMTYTLPKDKAEALATLLKDLKAPVLETQVKADGIVVTTTPEAQRVVGEFAGLLQGKVPAMHRTGSSYYPNNPQPK